MSDILVPDGKKLGWRIDRENFDWIDSLPEGTPFTYSAIDPEAYADLASPRDVVKVEDQNGFGSCQGHALSSCMEWAYYVATGDMLQLSRWMAYVATQLIDGIRGDSGSTIYGGAQLAKTKGVCLEADYPYPSQYTQRVTEEHYRKALPFRLKTFHNIRSVEDARAWVGGKLGGIDIGVSWGGGGHAIAILDYDEAADVFWYLNSWSLRWGFRGWGKWTSRELAGKLRESYTRAVGMTDLLKPVKPRKCDWMKKGFGRW